MLCCATPAAGSVRQQHADLTYNHQLQQTALDVCSHSTLYILCICNCNCMTGTNHHRIYRREPLSSLGTLPTRPTCRPQTKTHPSDFPPPCTVNTAAPCRHSPFDLGKGSSQTEAGVNINSLSSMSAPRTYAPRTHSGAFKHKPKPAESAPCSNLLAALYIWIHGVPHWTQTYTHEC